VRLLADHLWFKVPLAGRLWSSAGAVDGTRENAVRLLEAGELVLAYPGGVREIMAGRFGHENLAWEGRTGFAAVAIQAGVPVVPIAGIGVNNGHVFVSSGRLLGRLLFQGILKLGPAYPDYRDPLTIGLIPLPLPFSLAVHFPWPCKVRYVVGEPIRPPMTPGQPTEEASSDLAASVETAMRRLLEEHGHGERPRRSEAERRKSE